jgi:hypothetical protein
MPFILTRDKPDNIPYTTYIPIIMWFILGYIFYTLIVFGTPYLDYTRSVLLTIVLSTLISYITWLILIYLKDK